MSIIGAIASRKTAIVICDGRRFSSTTLDAEGKAVAPAKIESETWDKTFSVLDGLVVGANAGLLEILSKTFAEHISDVVLEMDDSGTATLYGVAKRIGDHIKSKLEVIPQDEVSFANRKLDILIVGQKKLRKGGFQI